jgi:hypothetical protein
MNRKIVQKCNSAKVQKCNSAKVQTCNSAKDINLRKPFV